MKRSRSVMAILCGVYAAVALTVYIAPRLKQRMLPSYASPERFAVLFSEQLRALVDVAEGRRTPEQVGPLFSNPAIHGAVAHDWLVKDFTTQWEQATRDGTWFDAEPAPGRPVVNIWGGRIAEFDAKFRAGGAIKDCKLFVDLSYLKQKQPD